MNKRTILILAIIILTLAGIGGGVYLVKRSQEVREKAAPATTISFQPETKEAKVGETINLNILMDTGENSLAAVRLDIDYDQSILQPLSLSFSSLLPIILRPIDISQLGKVTGSAGVATGASISGTGQKVASLSFKVLSTAPLGTTISFSSNTLASSATTEDESTNLIIRKNPATIIVQTEPTPTEPAPTSTPILTPTNTPAPTTSPPGIPTITSTPKPTATPTLSQVGIGEEETINPTATPSPTTTSSTSGKGGEEMPVTGGIIPTLVLFAGGIALILSLLLFI